MPGADYLGEVLLKALGTLGIRDYEGRPKRAHAALWSAVRAP